MTKNKVIHNTDELITSEVKLTEGPWEYRQGDDCCHFEVYSPSYGNQIVAGEYGIENKADARLIAASFDIAQGIQQMVESLDGDDDLHDEMWFKGWEVVKAAYAKGTGNKSKTPSVEAALDKAWMNGAATVRDNAVELITTIGLGMLGNATPEVHAALRDLIHTIKTNLPYTDRHGKDLKK